MESAERARDVFCVVGANAAYRMWKASFLIWPLRGLLDFLICMLLQEVKTAVVEVEFDLCTKVCPNT